MFETRFENERGEACELNSPITEQEIMLSMEDLKNSKPAGADGVVSEMFKFAGNCLIPYIHRLFNRIFDTGVYPVLWSNSTILPIHKKR